ncbi:bifunctional metallophosphatase/5'-nucleotidase [Archaeoglobus fulgidus]|uniref:5'-nucleotidase (Nt5) n=1 Tax=Archaeoglobus fulgidus (strain ATCC 49558 / DSM 4304 / JCM 9628 / NBRC 100126 / VC-16) TaxID=224325 RepID=O29385_ARCFU|nr:bifunctional UDP-sugar hydrolase/5'-nucleotidase [Archaeoglobus fulgidus]AAB90365.1 5'-nucleotidase (nt5) [Archaeoglobus fulgidus DSM 4304]
MKLKLLLVISIIVVLSSTSQAATITILHTNDEHSALIPYHGKGGFAKLAYLVKELEKDKQNVILVSAGDYIGGTPFSWLIAEGYSPEISIMQKVGYDVVTIGNHEFDYTSKALQGYLQNVTIPVVATNVHAEGPLGEVLKKHYIANVGGVKVGFIGILGVDAQRKVYSHENVTFEDPVVAAKEAVEDLVREGAEVIIALSHSGIDEDLVLAEEVPEIDVIIAGHDHRVLEEPIVTPGGTVIVETGDSLRYLGVLEIEYEDEVKLKSYSLLEINDSIPDDPEVGLMVQNYVEKLNAFVKERSGFNSIFETVVRSDFSLTTQKFRESNLGDFITDAMRFAVEKATGEKADIAVFANGEIRGNITPVNGEISLYNLLVPVSLGVGSDGSAGYSLVSFYLTGDEIYKVLEIAVLLQKFYGDDFFLQFSGLRVYYNPDNALIDLPFIDKKIPTVLLPGNLGAVVKAETSEGEIERDKLYRVVTDNYILSFLPKVAEVLPQLTVVPKDKHGNAIPPERFGELVIKANGREVKVWEAVVDYARSMGKIDDRYKNANNRINEVWSFPAVGYILAPIAVAAAVVAAVAIRKRG